MVIVRNGPIQWQSKLQRMTVDSVCEAEYIALSAAVKEVQYFRQLSNELGFPLTQSPTIFVDNESAEGLANGTCLPKRSKHIETKFHISRQAVEAGTIKIQHVCSSENLADVLTKPLSSPLFIPFKEQLVDN